MQYPHYQMALRCEYRFPGFHWNAQEQRWIPTVNTRPPSHLKHREIVHEHVDPATFAIPSYQPGQWVKFEDAQGRTHRGYIECAMIYSTSTEDPGQREYLFQWTYLSINAITYWIRLPDGTLYTVHAPAILSLTGHPHS